MRPLARLLCALALAAPATAQRIAAPQVRISPVPFSIAVPLPRLAAPGTLSSSLALPTPTLPRMQALAAPSVPNPIAAARAEAAPAPASARAVRLILMGPPGSGKTTYGKRLAAEYGSVHISVGELLRAYATEHPEVAATMAGGDLVDSALVLGLVKRRLAQDDVKARGYILDGFPRRLEEAVAMEGWLGGVGVDAVVHLEVSQEELLRRIHERGRADDTDATFANRMRVYRNETLPVLERLRASTGILEPEVSSSDPETNYARLRQILERALSD